MKNINKILDKAIEIASLMESDKHRHCAIITDKKNKILSIGINSYKKTSPLQKEYAIKVGQENKIYNHAELSAVIRLPYGSKPENICIARVDKYNKPCLSKPCKLCQLCIKEIGIKNIYYTK
jgi:deoxycytidylate deaminase